ncbi:MAG: manganese efflux pump MntP family protein [Defluviitaleaceae bacterium]|nr:manganese efflux pump MntP family protein [Defluviitaleaceae bacterium]MCL2275074.1 manganese efflux pump MntP family protein [Defluviitaleaceae bacterium]
MSVFQLVLLAVGLAMDAFAVAVTLGLGLGKTSLRDMFTVGAYFGIFQAVMPVIGFLAARWFANAVMTFDTWLVFALLTFLGGKMIISAREEEDETPAAVSLSAKIMLPFALATSIDALAVGISFAFLAVNVALAVVLIGVITLVVSMAGVKIGGVFGMRYKRKAALAGGVILILIGLRVLIEGFVR